MTQEEREEIKKEIRKELINEIRIAKNNKRDISNSTLFNFANDMERLQLTIISIVLPIFCIPFSFKAIPDFCKYFDMSYSVAYAFACILSLLSLSGCYFLFDEYVRKLD